MPRTRVLKNAKLVFDGSVMDVLLRNVSARGARVSTPVLSFLPDRAVLHLPGGAAYQAHRRWALGADAGFEFDSGPTLDDAAAIRALPLHEALCAASPAPVLAGLLAERCFDDPALRGLALELGDAHAALAAALKALATRGQAGG